MTVREFCVAHALSNNEGCKIYTEGDVLPAEYGTYAAYDGVDLLGAGVSRNVASSLEGIRYRLNTAKIPIFIWKTDDDGSVAKWLDSGIDEALEEVDDDEDDCPYCRQEII